MLQHTPDVDLNGIRQLRGDSALYICFLVWVGLDEGMERIELLDG